MNSINQIASFVGQGSATKSANPLLKGLDFEQFLLDQIKSSKSGQSVRLRSNPYQGRICTVDENLRIILRRSGQRE